MQKPMASNVVCWLLKTTMALFRTFEKERTSFGVSIRKHVITAFAKKANVNKTNAERNSKKNFGRYVFQ